MWKERNPTPSVKMTEVTLSNQRRMFGKTLTLGEQKAMENAVIAQEINMTQKEADVNPKPSVTELIEGDDKSQKGNSQCQTEREQVLHTEVNDDNKPESEMKIKMKENLMVTFDNFKMKSLCERKRIQTFKMTDKNKQKLVFMNEILTEFIEGKNWDITSLNTLHYSAAMVLAGEAPGRSYTKKQKSRTHILG